MTPTTVDRASLPPLDLTPPPASPPAPSAPAPRPGAGGLLADPRLAAAAIALLALLASVLSLRNGFAFDDLAIVLKNPRVHTLDAWWEIFGESYWPPPVTGGLYRPVTILGFALQWQLGGGAPWVFHLTSLVLYVGTCLSVYWLASQLLPRRGAWIAAALFAVHPVHVEVVGNVVGQSELWTCLAGTLAVAVYVRGRRAAIAAGRSLSPKTMAAVCALYAVAAWSKEHGLLLPGLLAAAELWAVPDAGPWRTRARAIAPVWLALAVIGAGYLAARATTPDVLDGARYTAVLLFFPWKVRLYAFLTVVPEWVRLLVWPARLAADYSPQELMVALQWMAAQTSGLGVVVLLVGGAVAAARRSRVAAFAAAWLAVTLTVPSGLLVPTGFLLAERTLFTPSVGFLLLVGLACEWALARWSGDAHRAPRLALLAAVALLVGAGAWRSAERQGVWKDNETLFHQTVRDAPLSYRAHVALGGHLFETKRFAQGERELRIAARLFPADPDPMDILAAQYVANDMCEPAIPLLQQVQWLQSQRLKEIGYGRSTSMMLTRSRLGRCYLATAQYDSARALARRTIAESPSDSLAFRPILRVADSALARLSNDAR